jgi:hypothetical protein
MADPLSHLEDCDFTKYVLQQSTYMYMAEQMLGVKPGNLGVIRMPWENKLEVPEIHLMPYMKMEVMAMIEAYAQNDTEEKITFDTEEIEEDFDILTV